jgi:CHAT domain-containing protein
VDDQRGFTRRCRNRLSAVGYRLVPALLVVAGLVSTSGPAGAEAASPESYLEEGMKAFERGAFEAAVPSWTEAARLYEAEGKLGGRLTALTQLSQAYARLGRYRDAVTQLEMARDLAQRSQQPRWAALVLIRLGEARVGLGALDTAEPDLREGLGRARALSDAGLTALALNNLGNLLTIQQKYPEAVAAYQEAVVLGKASGPRSMTVRAMINAATALRDSGAAKESQRMLDAALDELRGAEQTSDSAFLFVSVGVGYRALLLTLADPSMRLQASRAFGEARTLADRLGDRRTASYASGYLGALYEDEQRNGEALQLTRTAIFAAQQANAPESLYRWQWQAGRLLRKQGATDAAIATYRRALSTLQSIRSDLSAGRGAFRDSVGPVYLELADLLLQRAAALQDAAQIQTYLVEARGVAESLKAAELRDYFRDDCVDLVLAKEAKLDVVSRTAVVVYPILLPDRIELLISVPAGLQRFSVPVGAAAVTREVRTFRQMLEKRTTRQYLRPAQQLYKWLIQPVEPALASLHIDTLVFVPDGPLRTIPMGALHDGQRFLIEKYAVAITPGLNLTDPRPIDREHLKILALGVTQAVQGFPALPNVSAELQMLTSLFGSTTLADQDFVVARLEKALKDTPFTIVHVASHGHFGGDVKDTFLLAFDDKLTMDRLDQLIGAFKFREEPLDLLTLSACETAEGDDRAALGLAGVAIKAGARSAVATLWDINDRVSADLVAAFYEELREASTSRATALQHAQLKILGDPRYQHPGFWSAFLLINNWL